MSDLPKATEEINIVYLAHNFNVQSTNVGKARWQGLKAAAHIIGTVKKRAMKITVC